MTQWERFLVMVVLVWLAVLTGMIRYIQERPAYYCSRGVAVMTPQGYATVVCAP